jgi:DNA polymerase
MSAPQSALEQHLRLWAAAYGSDLAVPEGHAAPRAAAAAAPPMPAPPLREDAAPERSPRPISGETGHSSQAADSSQAAGKEPEASPGLGATASVAAGESERERELQALKEEVLPCVRCKLHSNRRATVFGEGSPAARVMFVGEAPGAKEDQSGRPFVGPAGQLLDRILNGAMGLRREDVFIANVNKCRPPNNRAPEADEVAACLPYLKRQVEIIRPDVIVCLGRTAAQNLLGTTESTTSLRRKQHTYADTPVVVTWHPAYLLREPGRKRETWEDIKKVNALLGLPEVPGSPR